MSRIGQSTLTFAAVCIAWLAPRTSTCAATYYVVSPVGPLPAQAGPTWAFDINDVGTVYGVALINGGRESRCFLLSNSGAFAIFATEQGHPYIWPGSINNSTDFVGTQMVTAPIGTRYESFVGVLPSLPDLFSQFPSGEASHGHDISNSVAGAPPWACGTLRQSQQIGLSAFSTFHAYLVLLDGNPNPAIDIPGLGGTYVRAEALNDARDVVGASLSAAGPMRAFLRTSAGTSISLGTLGGSHSWATDINNAQVIVGWSRTADGSTHAFRCQNLVMTDLGTLGGNISEAYGINDVGQIVGMSFTAQQRPRAFLHDSASMIDLNTRITANSGWILQYAKAINESGSIIGWGRFQNETRGFRLTPRGPGDATLDGAVDVNDLLAVIMAWGACPASPATCPADVAPAAGDGQVNVNDLLAVITNWAP